MGLPPLPLLDREDEEALGKAIQNTPFKSRLPRQAASDHWLFRQPEYQKRITDNPIVISLGSDSVGERGREGGSNYVGPIASVTISSASSQVLK